MPKCILLALILLISPLLLAKNSNTLTISEIPSNVQLDNLNGQLTKLQQQNQQKLAQIESLAAEMGSHLPPERIIQKEELSQTYIELEQARLQVDNIQAELNTVNQHISTVKQHHNSLNSLLQKLSNPLSGNDVTSEQTQEVAKIRDRLNRNQEYETLLNQQKQLTQESLALGQKHRDLLEKRYQRFNERYLEPQTPIGELPTTLATEDDTLLEQTRDRLANKLTKADMNRLTRLDINIELSIIIKQLFFNNLWRDYLAIERRLQDLQFVDFSSISLEQIENVQIEIKGLNSRIVSMTEQLEKNYSVISEQYELYSLQRRDIPKHIQLRQQTMSKRYDEIMNSLENSKLGIEIISGQTTEQFTMLSKDYLTKRYNFTHNMDNFPAFSKNLIHSSGLFAGQYVVAFKTFSQQLQKLNLNEWLVFLTSCLTLVVVTAYLTSYMNRLVRRKRKVKRLSFAARLLLFLFGMFKYNLPYIGLFFLVWSAITLTKITSPSYGLLLLPPIVLLMICIPYFSAKILINTELLKTADDRRIVRPIIFISTMGSILFALVIMAQMTLEDKNIIDAFRWFFGLYVLAISWPFGRMVRRSIRYLDIYYLDFLSYRILRIIIAIMPLATAVFGVTSVLGYLNFAWITGHYAIYFEIVAIIWVSLIALFKDASLWAKRYVLQHTNNGLFWAQDVITPVHTTLRYASLIILSVILFKLYGWDSETPFIKDMISILNTPLFQSGDESQFTLRNILLMGLLFYFIFRIGRWIRSLSYRWIYSKVLDLGIRNSLAVFSQYAVVTSGFLLALRIIGLDLTTFTVFAGALGVGIGFGMQNIANNFISGILLLIERPLRNGDIISVGNHTGTVERIGMRSLTMTTFDNESLILPNSDFVTSAFINRTHSDQVLRLCLYLDINYHHSPSEVTRILNQAINELVTQGKIINEGEFNSGVYAYDYSERGTTYRIIFYFDLEKHGHMETRNLVINAIWQACHDHHLQIAYPKRDIFFPAGPEQLAQHIQTHPKLNQ